MKELKIEAATEKLDEVLGFVAKELELHDCPMKAAAQLELAVEEIFVNIARYAYSPEVGEAAVRVEVKEDPLAIVITFLDNGTPYDPLAKEDPDITLSAEERGIGGLGIFMVKKSMDAVAYEYKDGQNILTITKNFFKKDQPSVTVARIKK